MIFSKLPQQQEIERLMTSVPRFHPKGSGVRLPRHFEYTAEVCDCRFCLHYRGNEKCAAGICPYIEERSAAGAASHAEIMAETMKNIRNAAFRRRLDQYIRESEVSPMNFRNETHRVAFEETIRGLDRKLFARMAAIYLLTADRQLWSSCKRHVNDRRISFESIRLNNCSERAYTLYCAAKDLTFGTKHLALSELADNELVAPMDFALICNAMAIRRFGIGAIQQELCPTFWGKAQG